MTFIITFSKIAINIKKLSIMAVFKTTLIIATLRAKLQYAFHLLS